MSPTSGLSKGRALPQGGISPGAGRTTPGRGGATRGLPHLGHAGALGRATRVQATGLVLPAVLAVQADPAQSAGRAGHRRIIFTPGGGGTATSLVGAGATAGCPVGAGAFCGPHTASGLHSQGLGAGPQVQSGFGQQGFAGLGGSGAAGANGAGAFCGPHTASGLHSQGLGAGPQVQSGFGQQGFAGLGGSGAAGADGAVSPPRVRTITLFISFWASSGLTSLPLMKARVVTVTPSGTRGGAGACATTTGDRATAAITESMLVLVIISVWGSLCNLHPIPPIGKQKRKTSAQICKITSVIPHLPRQNVAKTRVRMSSVSTRPDMEPSASRAARRSISISSGDTAARRPARAAARYSSACCKA